MLRRFLFACTLIAAVGLPTPANPYDDYKQLTGAEKKLALLYFWQLPGVKGAATFARTRSEAQYPALAGQDDQRDAYRHSMWNGSMVRRLGGTGAAKRWADAHEQVPNNPAARAAMDLENNERGRTIAWSNRRKTGTWWGGTKDVLPSDDEVARLMLDAVNQGRLVMIQPVNGQRDPAKGKLVATTPP